MTLTVKNSKGARKGVLYTMAPRKVWVRWIEKKKRWEVGFYWDRKPYRYYSWTIQSKRYSFTKDRKHIAEDFADYIRARMFPNEQGISTFHPEQLSSGKKTSLYNFDNYVKIWIAEKARLAQVGKRAKEYITHLERYHRLYWSKKLGAMDIREVNEPALMQFFLWLTEQGLGEKYIQNIMDALRQVISQAFRKARLQPPEFPDYKAKKSRKDIIWLTEEEQDRVIEALSVIHKPIAMFIAFMGCRLSEARFLQWSDVDLEKRTVFIKTLKKGPNRKLPLAESLVTILRSLPRSINHSFVFHVHGRPYAKTTLWKAMRKALDEAGFPNVTPNDFGRHSVASQLTVRGVNEKIIKEILGHADIRTTERYQHVRLEDKEAVMRK